MLVITIEERFEKDVLVMSVALTVRIAEEACAQAVQRIQMPHLRACVRKDDHSRNGSVSPVHSFLIHAHECERLG